MNTTKYKKIAQISYAIYCLGAWAAKIILIFLAITMNEWPSWFRAGLGIISILSYFAENLRGVLLAIILILGIENNILGIITNNLPHEERIIFILISILSIIFLIIRNRYVKKDKIINKNSNDLLSDEKWNKGYFDASAGNK